MADRTETIDWTCTVCKKAKSPQGWLRQVDYTVRKEACGVVHGRELDRYYRQGVELTEEEQRAVRRGAHVAHKVSWSRPPQEFCACGAWMQHRRMKTTENASVRCDARCWNATNDRCECSCGGKNHGTNHRLAA